MSTLTHVLPQPPTAPDQVEFVDTRQVPIRFGVSVKTLLRRQKEDGHDVGLRRVGRRLLVHVATLRAYLNSAAVVA